MHAAIVEQKHHGQTKDDVFLCIPPLYHTGAKMHWFGSLITGGKAVLLKGVNAKTILQTVSDEQCTIVWLLVPWAQDLLLALESGEVKLSDYKLDQWRLMHIGAQPVPQSLIKRWKEYFPHHQYDTNYGLSESIGPGAVHLGVENIDKVGAIGVPGYGWQVRIVDEDGKDVKQGDVGELLLKGPGVMTCYYKNPEATAETLKDGWLYTGDMAEQDADGFIYLVDRKKDVIISGGENIYPVQIENFLSKYPKVKDVAVIGLADPRLGEITAAIIETKDGVECTEDEINEFCKELPRYKRPRRIIFEDVPRNATGKIEKPLLRKKHKSDTVFDTDEGPRMSSMEVLGKLKPCFKKDGIVTAANSSAINDGAAALVIMSEEKAKELGVKPLATWVAGALAGVEPEVMGLGPIAATKKVMAKTGMTVADMDLVEANEAFAAQSVAVGEALHFDQSKLNVNGGAIALGHPVGASGARILVTLLYAMKHRGAHKGLATLCIGGGMGCATIVEM